MPSTMARLFLLKQIIEKHPHVKNHCLKHTQNAGEDNKEEHFCFYMRMHSRGGHAYD